MHAWADYWEFKLIHLRDTHSYNARHKHNFEMPKSRCQKGQERLTYKAIHAWNALPISTRNSISLDLFERPIKTILFILRFYQLYHGTLLLLYALLTVNKF